MAAPATADALLELVRKSGLVRPERMDYFLSKVLTSDSLPEGPVAAADALISAGLLTSYQAKKLLAGKHRGFQLGTYTLLSPLSKGGMSMVYLAEHTKLSRRVVLKILPPDRADDPASLGRFQREGLAAAALDHPNIVRVYDIVEASDIHFLVLEYIEGKTLDQIIKEDGALSIHRAVRYGIQIAEALQHAFEKGVVHRDIKPSNILVDSQDTIKILDMGLARFFDRDESDLTRRYNDSSVLGTADYMAPEQALCSAVDSRADIYSLGATLYTLLGGRPPFEGKSASQKLLAHQMKTARPLQELRPEVPAGLSSVIAKMMAKKPEERYQTPNDVMIALAPWSSKKQPRSRWRFFLGGN